MAGTAPSHLFTDTLTAAQVCLFSRLVHNYMAHNERERGLILIGPNQRHHAFSAEAAHQVEGYDFYAPSALVRIEWRSHKDKVIISKNGGSSFKLEYTCANHQENSIYDHLVFVHPVLDPLHAVRKRIARGSHKAPKRRKEAHRRLRNSTDVTHALTKLPRRIQEELSFLPDRTLYLGLELLRTELQQEKAT